MKHIKLLLLSLFMLIAILIGCSRIGVFKEIKEEPKKIAFISMKQGGQLWGNVKNGARMAHEETQCLVDFYAPIEETDSFSQIEYLEQAAAGDFDAIIIAPSDLTLLSTTVQKVQRRGAKVLQIYNETIAYDGFEQFKMMTDFTPVGDSIADFLIEKSGNNPIHVLLVGSLLHTSAGSQTELSIKQRFKDNSNINFETIYCFGDKERAEDLVVQKLKKNESINFIIALDETSSDGIIDAIHSTDSHNAKIIAWGNSLNNIEGLEDGYVDAIVAINGFGLGYRSIYAALDLIDGKAVPSTPLDFAIVTKDTFLEDRNQRLLFPQLL
jgi:ribose transport system substrate-binding protein